MSTVNDSKILALKADIEVKEKKLNKPIFSPKTNCNITIENIRYNLNVLEKDELTLLLVKVNSLALSAKDLGLSNEDVKISGFSISDWMEDIRSKLELCNYNQNIKQLDSLKETLQKLLSEDKRTEIEIDNIANILKGM